MKYFVLGLIFISIIQSFELKAPEISPGVFISGPMYVHQGQSTDPLKRTTSYPFMSSDTLRMFCTSIWDETKIPFCPAAVKDGDTIFLNAELLENFFTEIHPRIKNKYILVTHASDSAIPGKYRSCLDDDTLAAWFGTNVAIDHPKMFFIPIGIANRYWPHGNIEFLSRAIASAPLIPKNKLLYMNFTVATNSDRRKPAYDYFVSKPFCYRSNYKSYEAYLFDTAQSKFVLSPAGNGMDCHRTWEALFLGSFPVTKHSPLDKLFEQFPIVIVDDWSQVTEEFLNTKYEELKNFVYDRKKLYAPYWLDQIKTCQERVRAGLPARDNEELR
jgi:hypothetical protein